MGPPPPPAINTPHCVPNLVYMNTGCEARVISDVGI